MLHGRLLRYVDEVARLGSMRKASRTLNVAASALSRHILELEEELGAPIFERLPRGLRLTASGELLIAHIRDTLHKHERTLEQIRALKSCDRGQVSIATMAALAASLLTEVTTVFRDLHPGVRLNITVMNRPELVDAVASGQVDLGVAYNLPLDPRLQQAAEFVHKLGAVVAPNHPLAQHTTVRLTECLDYPVVTAQHGWSLRELLENLLPANVALNPVVETNSTEVMKRLTRNSLHLTFLDRSNVEQEVREGVLCFLPLSGAAGRLVLSIVHRMRGSLQPDATMFIQFVDAKLRSADAA
jgi:DNA-binding transcriptional LysR family regulator